MEYSQIFHQILYFPSEKRYFWIYLFIYLFENFNISENNVISVELAQVLFVLLILVLIFSKRPRPLCTASYILRLTNPG